MNFCRKLKACLNERNTEYASRNLGIEKLPDEVKGKERVKMLSRQVLNLTSFPENDVLHELGKSFYSYASFCSGDL